MIPITTIAKEDIGEFDVETKFIPMLRSIFICAVLLGAVWGWSADRLDQRHWYLVAHDPLRDFDATAWSYLSLQQALGFGDQSLTAQNSINSHWYTRTGNLLGMAYLNLAIGYYAHEIGHDITGPHFGDGRQWLTWPSGMPWPTYHRSRVYNVCGSWCQDFERWDRALDYSGLNMEAYASDLMAFHTHDTLSWDEGMAYLFRRLSPVTYDLYSPDGFKLKKENGHWKFELANDIGDPAQYLGAERAAGNKISYGDFYLRCLVPQLLTFRVYESFATGLKYWHDGTMSRVPWSWHVQGLELQPPIVTDYVLRNGTLWDSHFLLRREGQRSWHRLTLGMDADWIGQGSLQRWHFAMENPWFTWNTPWRNVVRTSLEQSFNWERAPLNYLGCELSAKAQVGLWRSLALDMTVAYSHEDLLAQEVRLEDNGLRWTVGLQGEY